MESTQTREREGMPKIGKKKMTQPKATEKQRLLRTGRETFGKEKEIKGNSHWRHIKKKTSGILRNVLEGR